MNGMRGRSGRSGRIGWWAGRCVTVAVGAGLVASSAMGTPGRGAQDDFPTTGGAAMRYYESHVDEWDKGPVEYIMTPEEFDIWDELEETDQKAAFIEWFWDRRDEDARNPGNPYREEFYARVARANQRFRDFPRGWKSNRGLVQSILGVADSATRRTWGSLFGAGTGPDFEVWAYYTLGNNRAFSASGGTFEVYFIESRPGKFEVYDFGFRTAGSFDRNIRLAFELTIEASIIDPRMEFEPARTRGAYVRELSEGTLAVEIPLDLWTDVGAGGAVSVPVEVALADLLFQPDGEDYVAELDASLAVHPVGGGETVRLAETWAVRLGQDQLVAVGNGSLIGVLSAPAEPGSHEVQLALAHGLAGSTADWAQTVTVTPEPAAAVVVGRLAMALDPSEPSRIGVVRPRDNIYESGGRLVIGAWIRGAQPSESAVSAYLESPGGDTHVLTLEAPRWLGAPAGPLLIETLLPELEADMYTLRLDLGAGTGVSTTQIEITR